MEFFFSILWKSRIFTGNFMFLKSNFLANSLSGFVILLELWFAGFKYLTIRHLKHSLSSIFVILTNPFLGWSNSLGNLIQLLPAEVLYFEILMLWLTTELIIHPELFLKDFCMLDIIVVYTDLNTFSM